MRDKIEMDDIYKVKIEILRDAIKDASDTIRALDRKIAFLVTFNGIFLTAFSTLVLKQLEKININEPIMTIFILITITWVILLLFTIYNLSPKFNPQDALFNAEKNYANDIYFILYNNEKHSLKNSLEKYKKITNEDEIQQLLFKEIIKLSFIRDKKIQNINYSIKGTIVIVTIFVICFISYRLSY